MRRSTLFTAVAATALLAAPAAFAQTVAPGVQPMASQTPPTSPPASLQTPPPMTPPAAQVPDAPAAPTMPAMPGMPAAPAAATPAATNTVVDALRTDGHFTTLLGALDRAQLTQTLTSRPAVSIFAPTDAAFAAMSEADRTRLMDPANAAELRQLLLYHVIVADVETAQIDGRRGEVETAAGAKVTLDGTGGTIKADEATVSGARIDASNGAVFPIDHVLSPPAATAATAATPAVTPPADESAAPVETPPAATTTPAPAAPGATAPTGQPATTMTTTAAPPVPNPTDGQVDRLPDASRPTPPVQTPDPVDGAPNGQEPNPANTPVPTPAPGS